MNTLPKWLMCSVKRGACCATTERYGSILAIVMVQLAGTLILDLTNDGAEQEALVPAHLRHRRVMGTHDEAAHEESEDRKRADHEVRGPEGRVHVA